MGPAAPEPVEVIYVSDDENHCCPIPPYAPALHAAEPPRNAKHELYRIVNAFQNSQDYGVYVCQKFRDPRRHYIDSYYGEVAHEAFGIVELGALIGKTSEPLSPEAKAEFSRFAGTLREIAERIHVAISS